ncbi:hypothetical protein EJ07DRAFT_57614, partial [Lizonia empirigonia]
GDSEDFEEMGSAMCNPFGAPHGTSVYNFAPDDGYYQFGSELLDEGGKDYATCDAGLDPATSDSLDGSSRDFHPIEESGTAKEDHSATHF